MGAFCGTALPPIARVGNSADVAFSIATETPVDGGTRLVVTRYVRPHQVPVGEARSLPVATKARIAKASKHRR
jgi:hypothetical protein